MGIAACAFITFFILLFLNLALCSCFLSFLAFKSFHNFFFWFLFLQSVKCKFVTLLIIFILDFYSCKSTMRSSYSWQWQTNRRSNCFSFISTFVCHILVYCQGYHFLFLIFYFLQVKVNFDCIQDSLIEGALALQSHSHGEGTLHLRKKRKKD